MSLSKNIDVKLLLCLAGVTSLVYFAAIFFNFSFVDDPVYIYKNPLVTNYQFYDIFAKSYFANYIPLTLLTYCFDYAFWGNDPAGYHLTNIIFHLLNCILLYSILNQMTKNRLVSFLTVFIFAVHPLQIQTVVWISERKSVVSLYFMLISFLLFMEYKVNKRLSYYIFCFIAFIFSILSKPIAVTYFLMLFAYDIFITDEKFNRTILNKIPFILVSIIISLVTFNAQKVMGAVKIYHGGSFYSNLITIPKAAAHYLKTIVYPERLLFFYDLKPAQSIFEFGVLFGIVLIALLIFILIRSRKDSPVISFGIAIFFIFWLPVCGIVPIEIIVADRYMYIPIIGLTLAFFYFIDRHVRWERPLIYVPTLFLAVLLSFITVRDSFSWQEREGIFEDVFEADQSNMPALNSLIELNMTSGNDEKAYEYIQHGLKVDEANPVLLMNYAAYKSKAGDEDGALALLKRALTADPYDKEIYMEIARIHFNKKEYDKALDILTRGIDTGYEFPLDTELNYRFILASTYVRKIMFDKAIHQFAKIIELSGDHLNSKMRFSLLSKYNDEFKRLRESFIGQRGGEDEKERLRNIFIKLNLQEEGELYIKGLELEIK